MNLVAVAVVVVVVPANGLAAVSERAAQWQNSKRDDADSQLSDFSLSPSLPLSFSLCTVWGELYLEIIGCGMFAGLFCVWVAVFGGLTAARCRRRCY